jgi:hypothetical protein
MTAPPSVPAFEAFIRGHEYCGELDTPGPSGPSRIIRVWMTCTCGAVSSRALEPAHRQ